LRVPQEKISLEELTVKSNFTYKEYPVRIWETTERVTRSWIFRVYKVQWNQCSEEEAICKREEDLRKTYPQLLE